ncbi:MAG: hypothetical protein N2510_06000 [Ignavibacteria bacterium]|nr:hypothetical protein [Ignavibacteria bacterium]
MGEVKLKENNYIRNAPRYHLILPGTSVTALSDIPNTAPVLLEEGSSLKIQNYDMRRC